MSRSKKRSEPNARPRTKRAYEPIILFGLHTVEAALGNPLRKIGRFLATENAANRLKHAANERCAKAEIATPRDIDRFIGTSVVHQGVALEVAPLPMPEVVELARPSSNATAMIVVLDQVTDPHNVGAILRSAAAFGANGLVMTQRKSPPLSGTLAKAACGALEHVAISLQPNLSRALAELGDCGITRVGLDATADVPIEGHIPSGPTALVLGAEDRGLRRLTQENCDLICRIATYGPMRSLNVSNAAAVALHVIATKLAANH